ncbi:MAG: hypothetical protein RL490_325 [Pseudomonadota bacterium]|jgi:hypothetical protein
MSIFLKDPAATIDYAVDWSAGYLAGQALAAADWLVAPVEAGGITLAASRFEPGRAVATLVGGIAGRVYRITNRVTFSDGRSDDRTLVVRVEER